MHKKLFGITVSKLYFFVWYSVVCIKSQRLSINAISIILDFLERKDSQTFLIS